MNSTAFTDQTFQRCSGVVQALVPALLDLQERAQIFGLEPLTGREWFELLRQKLVPQLGDKAYLVVAVVGGTNIGKSVIFNHLAGCRASASSPLASGTKHVTCLVPAGFSGEHDLRKVFPDFELQEWSDASLALQDSEAHRIFWRTAPELPESLLILDTPDIDSDARVNWVRADAVRRSADVLIAVLTQQKYNDAAVKEFFRKAGDEQKSVIVIFNQVLLPEDEPYWPVWLETFCRETHIRPECVYLAPSDRRAAEELRLPFFERSHSTCLNPDAAVDPAVSRSLSADLARLKFRDIRLKTLHGSLKELAHPQRGIPGWLRELRTASQDLRQTSSRLAADSVIQVRHWPSPPNAVLVTELRKWWSERQVGWARKINSAYNVIGNGILWPIRAAKKALQGEPVPPMEDYRQREWSAILNVVEELFDKLHWMAESGNDVIKPRVEKLLRGDVRTVLLRSLREQHDQVVFDDELVSVVEKEMTAFEKDRPDLFSLYRQLNNVSAAVRPVTSVVLFSMGFGPAGEMVAPMLGHAAASAVIHVVADVAGGATAAVAGEAAVSTAAGTGAGMLQAWFHRLHSSFTERRVAWLTTRIHDQLLQGLPEELSSASGLPESESFRTVSNLVTELSGLT